MRRAHASEQAWQIVKKRGKQDPFVGFDDVELIGRGAFAQVYRATDTYTGQAVALKVLNVAASKRLDTATFELEARALGAVNGHPNVVTLHRAMVRPSTAPVLVLDLCQGSLSDRLEREGPLPAEQVVSIGVKLCGALETAHRAGILHRDVKPQNVLITRYGEPALADFGVAALRDAAAGSGSPLSGMTLLHAAPEVILGHPASPASDVYGLVSTLYELLGGHAPHFITADEDPAVVQRRVLTAPPPALRAPGVTRRLAAVIARSLAKTPEERPVTAVELAQELRLIERSNGWPLTPCRIAGEEDLPIPDAPLPPPTAAPSRAAMTTGVPNLGLGARPLSAPGRSSADGRGLEPLGPRETVLLPSRGSSAEDAAQAHVPATRSDQRPVETTTSTRITAPAPAPEDAEGTHGDEDGSNDAADAPSAADDASPVAGPSSSHPADRLIDAPSGLFPGFGDATPADDPATPNEDVEGVEDVEGAEATTPGDVEPRAEPPEQVEPQATPPQDVEPQATPPEQVEPQAATPAEQVEPQAAAAQPAAPPAQVEPQPAAAPAQVVPQPAAPQSVTPPPAPIPAGWYQDPGQSGRERWWDGAAWTEWERPTEPPAAPTPPPADPQPPAYVTPTPPIGPRTPQPPPVQPSVPATQAPSAAPVPSPLAPPEPAPDPTAPLWGFEERRGLHETIGLASSTSGRRSSGSKEDEPEEGKRRRGKRKNKDKTKRSKDQ